MHRSFLGLLGRCPRCMRTAFLFAIGAWAAFTIVASVAPDTAWLIKWCAILLTALWVAHLIAFAWKRAAPSPSLARRQFLRTFFKALGLSAVATVSPGLLTFAFGAKKGPCDNCSRYRGTDTCWTCCSCQHDNNIAGCKKERDPNKYNTCIGNSATTWANCQKGCK
jgi:hypothetical protein